MGNIYLDYGIVCLSLCVCVFVQELKLISEQSFSVIVFLNMYILQFVVNFLMAFSFDTTLQIGIKSNEDSEFKILFMKNPECYIPLNCMYAV